MAFTAITDDMDLQSAALANEYYVSFVERGGSWSGDAPAAGEDIQLTSPVTVERFHFKKMQTWIQNDAATTWVQSHETNGTLRANGYYDNKSTIDLWTWANFKLATGLTSGFRRATTWPADWTDYSDAAYSYGPIQAGDIRGPWIFQDLQDAFKKLLWTLNISTDITPPLWKYVSGTNYKLATADGHDDVFAVAKALSEAEYDGSGSTQDDAPRSISRALHDEYSVPPPEYWRDYYETALWARMAYLQAYGVYTGVDCDAEFYAYAVKTDAGIDHNTWNANGDDVLENKWSLWLTDNDANGAATVTSSTRLGDLTYPVWVAEPALHDNDAEGYRVTDQAIIFRWDFTHK